MRINSINLLYNNQINNQIYNKNYNYKNNLKLIKASCGENDKNKYPEYFKMGEDAFKPLLKALGKPER